MKSNKPLIIANWKTALSYQKATQWLMQHVADLVIWQKKIDLIICPEQISLALARHLLPNSIAIGAQNCSSERPGRATGTVSIESLHEAAITHCIVNHHETATPSHLLKEQITLLQAQHITPIICVNNSQELEKISQTTKINPKTVIALEPHSAIGKNAAPIEFIVKEITKMQNLLKNQKNHPIVYGGGVNEKECATIFTQTPIDGFLIGRASSDFQALEKIVSSLLEETTTQEKCI